MLLEFYLQNLNFLVSVKLKCCILVWVYFFSYCFSYEGAYSLLHWGSRLAGDQIISITFV